MDTYQCPFGLAFASAPPTNGLTLLKRVTRRPVLQKVRHHTSIPLILLSLRREEEHEYHSALTACKQMVSGSISFPSRGAFHLSLTVLVHYRSPGYLALESGLPSFPTGSSCPVVLKYSHHTVSVISITGLSPAMAGLSRRVHLQPKICNCARYLPYLNVDLQHHPCNGGSLSHTGWFGLFPVRSPLLRE
jgi:hypothetical protein